MDVGHACAARDEPRVTLACLVHDKDGEQCEQVHPPIVNQDSSGLEVDHGGEVEPHLGANDNTKYGRVVVWQDRYVDPEREGGSKRY